MLLNWSHSKYFSSLIDVKTFKCFISLLSDNIPVWLKTKLHTIIFTSSVVSVLGLQGCYKMEQLESVYTIKQWK